MSDDLSDFTVLGLSLPRPAAGAVIDGPCRFLNVSELSVPRLPGPLLVAIHAQDVWRPEELERVAQLWPACPIEEKRHACGLIGVALVAGFEWIPANGAAAEDPWAEGPWVLRLQDVVRFKTPASILGYPGLFALPDVLASRIAGAWVNRPPENGRSPLAAFSCPSCRIGTLITGQALPRMGTVAPLAVAWSLKDDVGLCATCRAPARHKGQFVEPAGALSLDEQEQLRELARWLTDLHGPPAVADEAP